MCPPIYQFTIGDLSFFIRNGFADPPVAFINFHFVVISFLIIINYLLTIVIIILYFLAILPITIFVNSTVGLLTLTTFY
jgi:hypothetical protein